MMPFDLASLDTAARAESGHELQLRHPVTQAPLPMFITVRGMDGETWRSKQRELQRARLDVAQRRSQPVAEEDLEDDFIKLLGAITLGWRGEFTLDGGEIAFSTDAAERVYRRFVWIREQVAAAGSARANFLPGPPSS